MSLNVVIAGGNGRMGHALVEAVNHAPGMTLLALTLAEGESVPVSGAVASSLYTHDLDAALEGAQVLIDFTAPAAVSTHAGACVRHAVAWVLGTTGLGADEQASVDHAAGSIAVCQAANFSSGVTLMLRLVELAAAAMDGDTDLEVIEAHHRHKVDAPSGTALAIGKAMAAARGEELDTLAVMSREGNAGPRREGSIGFATIRGGDIVGDHTALFVADGERLEISHRASSRQAFARGACRAAQWLDGRAPALYDMQDVLGLRKED